MSTSQQLDQIWADVASRLRVSLPENVYQTWFTALRPLALEGSALYLEAPGDIRDWIKRRFSTTLNVVAAEVNPSVRRVEIVDPSDHRHKAGDRDLSSSPLQRRGTALSPQHTFDRFVIGNANRFAHAAALAVAEMPSQVYNPLFIHGPAGAGKTHLLQAIGNYIQAYDRQMSVLYATGESFTSQFTHALQQNRVDLFKQTYRGSDVLILDDAQFLEGKAKTAEELLHTLDAALQAGTQLILSGNQHPSRIPLLEARLTDRLQAGLIADLELPDDRMRLRLLEKEASARGLVIKDPTVLKHIATSIDANFRLLKGAFTRIAAFASLTGSELDTSTVDEVLSTLYTTPHTAIQQQSSHRTTIYEIQAQISGALQVTAEDLCSPSRRRHIVYARQLAMYLARELTDLSLPAIAREFGDRDHTTVLHAHRKVQHRLRDDPSTQTLVASLNRAIEAGTSTQVSR